ncbi:MAG: BspA family leucine-rich repeat surface protein, partial [Clostridia bacterium]|nr:BspA family leucine-rich repeat surface protein [Clostridia bacterium]
NLTSLDLSGFDTSQVTVMDYMFNGCSSLTSLDLSNFDMTNVTSVSRMLYGCSGLTTLDLSSFDMTNVTNVSSMLYGTTNLVEIVAPRNVSDSYKIDLYKNFYNKATGAGPYTQITAANCSASTTNKTTLTTGFAISYNLNGGTVETANPSLYNRKTTEQTITLNEPTKEGYGLASWEFTTNTTPASTISGNVLTIPANATGKISLKANLLKSEGYLNRSWRNLLGLSDSEIKEIYIQKEKPAGYESMTAKSVGSNEYNVASYSGECFDVTAYYTTHSSGSGYTVYITCPYTIFAPKMSDNLFSDLSSLIKIEFLNFDTSKTSSMHSMFTNSKMETLDLSCFDTSNVTTMSQMFRLCDKLVTLNVESFNTSKVTSMYSMFAYCKKLENVDVSHFKTGAITESDGLVYMFNECNSLISLDLSNWHISTVTSLNSMFQNCSKLTSLDVSKWNTSNVTSMYCLFTGCKKLATIDVSKWNTSKVTTMHAMFASCESLQSINVSSFDTSNVTDMSGMFEVCYALTDITGLKKLDTSKVTDMNRMFYYCNKLTSLDVSGFDTSEVTNMSYMFNNCIYLTSINVSNFNTSKVTNMQSMFYACRNIEYINISNFDMTKVTTVSGMFSSNDSLVEIVAPRNVSDSYPINLYKNFYNKATGAGPYTQINSTNCSTEGSIVTLTRIFQISYNTSGLTTTEENTNTYINDINIQYVYLKNPIVTSGVTFNGWSFVTNSTPASTISGSTLTIPANAMGHIELKANIEFAANYQFEISLQNVFQDDGETLKSGITYSGTQTVNYTSESSIVLPTLTKDYTTRVWWEVLETSGNWTKGETFEMGQTIASGKYGNIKLVLKYEWDLYTVVFNNNGHGSTTIPSVQILYNTGLGTVLTEMPTLEDNLYTFEGWYKTSELKGSIVSLATLFNNSQGYTFDATTKTFTIYAKWTAKKFGVTFVSDGQLGGIAFADQISNLSYGATVALPTDIKLGYNFIGWATSESGGDLYTDTFTMLTGEVILYAQWSQENYTITFDANGGSVSLATQTYKYGDTLSLPTPTKSGKTFKGWYLETAVEVWDGTTMTAPTGSGTRADPYIIQSGANLAYISNQLQTNASGVTNYENKFFVQTKNINLGGHEFTPIGANYNTGFRGTYNGNGFEIHGLKIAPTATNTYYGGLFGWIGTQNVFGMVANVTIVNAIINVTTNVSNNKKINIGTLAGCVQQGYIVNCKAINTSIGYEDMNYAANKVIGGLVGTVTVKAYIDNCYTSGAIISGHQICEKGTQTNCTSDIVTGTTTATASTAGTFGVTTTARTGTYKLETTYPFVGNVTVYAKWE